MSPDAGGNSAGGLVLALSSTMIVGEGATFCRNLLMQTRHAGRVANRVLYGAVSLVQNPPAFGESQCSIPEILMSS